MTRLVFLARTRVGFGKVWGVTIPDHKFRPDRYRFSRSDIRAGSGAPEKGFARSGRRPQKESRRLRSSTRCCIPRRFSITPTTRRTESDPRNTPACVFRVRRLRLRARLSRGISQKLICEPAAMRSSLIYFWIEFRRTVSSSCAKGQDAPDPFAFLSSNVLRHRNSPLSAIVSRISIACSRDRCRSSPVLLFRVDTAS